MNLTDIIPPGQLDKLTHGERDKDKRQRCKRIEAAYGEDIMKCMRGCGMFTNDPEMEYALTMSAIATIDFAIEQATKETQ